MSHGTMRMDENNFFFYLNGLAPGIDEFEAKAAQKTAVKYSSFYLKL